MANPTLLDIAKANGSDALVGLIDEATKTHPEIMRVPARTIKGMNYKTLVRTANPSVAFRNANEGTAATVGTVENRLVETFILNPRWECDKAVADRHEDGAAAFIAMEGVAILEAAMQALAAQFYYGRGTGGDAKGHPGLIDAYDSTNMVVDAGGTTATTGSSAWLVKFGPKDVQWVYGNGGALDLSEVVEERILDGSSNPFTGYVQELLAYPGLQVGSQRSVCRIKKLTEDSGKGLTDALLYSALEKFTAGIVPDVILVTRRSLRQLRASRTATNSTGAPAPLPTDLEGIPILVTEALTNTESLSL